MNHALPSYSSTRYEESINSIRRVGIEPSKERFFSLTIWSWARQNQSSTQEEFEEKYAGCVRFWGKYEKEAAEKLLRETPLFDGLA